MIFRQKFGFPPTYIAEAPLRVLLLGNHWDFTEGLALSTTINHHVDLAVSPRADGRIALATQRSNQREKFWLTNIDPKSGAAWTAPVKAVLNALREHGVHFSGFNATACGTLPAGMGLGGTSALSVATMLALRELFPYRITASGTMSAPRRGRGGRLPPLSNQERLQTALMCTGARNRFLDSPGTLLDPITSLYGKTFHALGIDFLHRTVEQLPLIGETALVICDTGPRPRRPGPTPSRLDRLYRFARHVLKAANLRSIEPSRLNRQRRKLSQEEFHFACHIVAENQRVVFAERALEEGDLAQVGQFMLQSHESLRENVGMTTPEVDLLVGLARSHPACIGARMTSSRVTVNLVKFSQMDSFIQSIAKLYESLTRRPLKPLFCPTVDGAKAGMASDSMKR